MSKIYYQELLLEAKRKYRYCPNSGLFFWKISTSNVKAGQIAGGFSLGYIRLYVNKRLVMAHRLAWAFVYGEFPKNQIDHIDGNRANNKIVNLRDVTQEVNLQNQTRAHNQNKLALQNIRKRKDNNKYQVRINKEKRQFYVGEYINIMDAIQARDIARIILSMPKSRSNHVYS